MTNDRITTDQTPVAILSRNRDLALDTADAEAANGRPGLAQYAQGQAQAYSEAIRILSRNLARPTPPVEQFRCGFTFRDGVVCGAVAKHVDPDGGRHCAFHAPTDVELTITEHDDQRDNR